MIFRVKYYLNENIILFNLFINCIYLFKIPKIFNLMIFINFIIKNGGYLIWTFE